MAGFEIAYRTGGKKVCEWRRMLVGFRTREEANIEAAKLERMGYKSVVHPQGFFDTHGLPIGWNHDSVDYENDHIEIDRFYTKHRSASL